MNELPRILLVADKPHWAWFTMQQWLIRSLGHHYDFYTDYLFYHPRALPRPLRPLLSYYKHKLKNRKCVRTLRDGQEYDIVMYLGFYFPFFGTLRYKAKKIVKGIYNDGFPPACTLPEDADISLESFVAKYLADADAVTCGSRLIYERYAHVVPHCYYATSAGASGQFRRTAPLARNGGRRFVVGWTGKPSRAFKGFHDFVVPAVEAAKQRRPGIELKTRFAGPIETLPRFYDDVDVVLIASDADAGPSLFDDACACQVPSISTRIGGPYELIRHGENGLLVERDVEEMANALVHLYDDRDLLFSMACRIRTDWLKKVRKYPWQWMHMFDSVLQDRWEPGGARREDSVVRRFL